MLTTHLSHDVIWRILVAFGALPTLAVYAARRKLKETSRFLKAAAQEEDDAGRLKKSAHYDARTHSVSFWDGFHRLVDDKKILVRLIGAAATWFLMDFAYYGNTVSSPLVLSSLGSDHTVLQKTLTQLGIFVLFGAPGYAVAALTMDKLGRKTIQILGFAMMAVTFGLLALIPNVETLFFPFFTAWHGLPAAEGAAGIVSVLGLIVTIFMLPETKGKSLEELSDQPASPVEKAVA